ncbi:MAG: capsule assembly Wzi family protein [Gammaproteobacteria bacterium]|nr:capsule assembly Wzi family protein [Gammaproteobacteria bacterium]
MKWSIRSSAALLVALAAAQGAMAEPWLAPGDTRLRNDLQLLNDAGLMQVPLSAWPLSWGDIEAALQNAQAPDVASATGEALQRIESDLRTAATTGEPGVRFSASVADDPRFIRSFANTPRGDAEASGSLSWTGDIFALNLSATLIDDPVDDDEFSPDGTYIGMALGNWMLSAGWQERWWGPGRDGSLILSTNARPSPGIAIQRNRSTAFESKWLRWIGPWSLTSFINLLDDDREIDDALLFGLRITFRPIDSLEIGLSRTAQFCGDDRPCDARAFTDMLVGNDNAGTNVDPEDEPGNQLAGFDFRWVLPREMPLALYAQWIGEDGRNGTAKPGSWLRQAGLEYWGRIGSLAHRTHMEFADTSCREGGLGFSDIKPNCAYEHSIYKTGYRYNGKSLGHGIDGDGRSYSMGSTLLQSAGHSWNILVRYMEINRVGEPEPRHSISPTPQDRTDIQLTHDRWTRFGRFCLGLGYTHLDEAAGNATSNDISAFLSWSSP